MYTLGAIMYILGAIMHH